jgi:Subtilase family
MMLQWTQWQPLPSDAKPPYIDWWITCPPPEFRAEPGPGSSKQHGFSYLTLQPSVGITDNPAPGAAIITKLDDDFGSFKIGQGPLPAKAHNDKFNDYFLKSGWQVEPEKLPRVRLDTVIVGVIDSGIALGNTRFRNSDGSTRFLAAWQQDADYNGQEYLPFGNELYQADIDDLITKHSIGGQDGYLAEDDFNREAGLIDMLDPLRSRELAGRTAHGTFVADLAAGDDPDDADPRIKIIAVNLPNRATINNSGIFLDYFTIYAVKRIADLADQIWDENASAAQEKAEVRGFPIVINLSFGKNAGGKDGGDYFVDALRKLNKARKHAKRHPVYVVLPVGNHNLEQGNACFRLSAGKADEIGFRVLPDDQSSNYLEIWSDRLPNPKRKSAAGVDYPFEIAVRPPGMARLRTSAGSHKMFMSLCNPAAPGDIARLYCGVKMEPDGLSYRIWYILCSAPTIQHGEPGRASPAGVWSIAVRNRRRRGDAIRIFLSAQTDQSIHPQAATGLLPRLERPGYERYLPDGRSRDSYLYPYHPQQPDQETSKVLRRHGSINATAMSKDGVIAVAGHRLSDGRPAIYSATGAHADNPPVSPGRSDPTVSFVTDDGYAHFGILAAGAANGSVVAMRGTSFAAAQATRRLSMRLKDGVDQNFDAEDWLKAQGLAAELGYKQRYSGKTPPAAKVGGGRIDWQQLRPVNRFG